jgi:hypothetical protein
MAYQKDIMDRESKTHILVKLTTPILVSSVEGELREWGGVITDDAITYLPL